jgi:hypothetical protein
VAAIAAEVRPDAIKTSARVVGSVIDIPESMTHTLRNFYRLPSLQCRVLDATATAARPSGRTGDWRRPARAGGFVRLAYRPARCSIHVTPRIGKPHRETDIASYVGELRTYETHALVQNSRY